MPRGRYINCMDANFRPTTTSAIAAGGQFQYINEYVLIAVQWRSEIFQPKRHPANPRQTIMALMSPGSKHDIRGKPCCWCMLHATQPVKLKDRPVRHGTKRMHKLTTHKHTRTLKGAVGLYLFSSVKAFCFFFGAHLIMKKKLWKT